MNIALDLTWMSKENTFGGTFQYGMRIASSLTNCTDNTVIAVITEGSEELFDHLVGYKNFKLVIMSNWTFFSTILEQEQVDIIHTPIQLHLNFTLSVPMITTLHDLQPFYFPEFFTKEEIGYRNVHYRKSADFSERIIVSYQHVKDDLIKFYNIPPTKIDVCSHGMAESEKVTASRIDEIKRKYNLPGRYLFYAANTWRHKNHIGLLRGVKLLHELHGIDIPLICTGCQYPDFFPQIEQEISRLALENTVRFLGYLPDDEMPAILCGAALTVVPTLYEAGSYPLMEAMNHGVPVICSTTTSLPDTIGDLRFVFNPNSPEEMAEKMAMMLTDDIMRKENVANSVKRVVEWRWEKAINSFLECYQKAIDSFAEKKKNSWFSDWAGNYEFFMNQKAQSMINEVSQLRAKVVQLEGGKARCKEIIAALSCAKAAVDASLSWRISKPLRWLGDRIRSWLH
jgi:glycosyltransferase involved in cell wall biosynthesis